MPASSIRQTSCQLDYCFSSIVSVSRALACFLVQAPFMHMLPRLPDPVKEAVKSKVIAKVRLANTRMHGTHHQHPHHHLFSKTPQHNASSLNARIPRHTCCELGNPCWVLPCTLAPLPICLACSPASSPYHPGASLPQGCALFSCLVLLLLSALPVEYVGSCVIEL